MPFDYVSLSESFLINSFLSLDEWNFFYKYFIYPFHRSFQIWFYFIFWQLVNNTFMLTWQRCMGFPFDLQSSVLQPLWPRVIFIYLFMFVALGSTEVKSSFPSTRTETWSCHYDLSWYSSCFIIAVRFYICFFLFLGIYNIGGILIQTFF